MKPPRSRVTWVTAVALAACAAVHGPSAQVPQERAAPSAVLCLELRDDPITPVTARAVVRALDQARSTRSECLVLVLDTPGGLLDSTRDIVRGILGAQVPVVVWVPPGGHAASAGLFVTLAGHVAAMAPGSQHRSGAPRSGGGPSDPTAALACRTRATREPGSGTRPAPHGLRGQGRARHGGVGALSGRAARAQRGLGRARRRREHLGLGHGSGGGRCRGSRGPRPRGPSRQGRRSGRDAGERRTQEAVDRAVPASTSRSCGGGSASCWC